MMAWRLGWLLGARRLTHPLTLVSGAALLLLLLLLIALERQVSVLAAADRVLFGPAFGLLLPLVGFLTLERLTERQRLDEAVAALARHGADRRLALLGLFTAAAVALCLMGALLGAFGVMLARGVADPAMPADAAVSAAIGAGGGIAYAAWFSLGSSFGARGGGRVWALGLDWMFGIGSTAIAVPWPRAHIASLIGASPVLGLPVISGWFLLFGLSALDLALAIGRAPP